MNQVKFICPQCGKTPPKDEEKSNENWNVISMECPDCKVRLKIEF